MKRNLAGHRGAAVAAARGLMGVVLGVALVACAAQPPGETAATDPGPLDSPRTTAAPTEAAPDVALFIQADTVLGPKNLTEEERPVKTCVQTNRFAQNEEVVWRVSVIDPLTGEALDDTQLESVVVQLPGESLDMRYGPHPRENPVDFFWTVAWMVPEGYPTGTVEFTVEATDSAGRTGTYEQFKVEAAMLTVTDEVREAIPEG
jgi:hypothetical protein